MNFDDYNKLTVLIGPFSEDGCRVLEISRSDQIVGGLLTGCDKSGCTMIIETSSPNLSAEGLIYEMLELIGEYRQYLDFLKSDGVIASSDPLATIFQSWRDEIAAYDQAYSFADKYLDHCTLRSPFFIATPDNVRA